MLLKLQKQLLEFQVADQKRRREQGKEYIRKENEKRWEKGKQGKRKEREQMMSGKEQKR